MKDKRMTRKRRQRAIELLILSVIFDDVAQLTRMSYGQQRVMT